MITITEKVGEIDEYKGVHMSMSQIKDIREKVIDVLRNELPKEARTIEMVSYILDEVKTRLENTPIL